MRRFLLILATLPIALLLQASPAQATTGGTACVGDDPVNAVDCVGGQLSSGLVEHGWFTSQWNEDNARCCGYAGLTAGKERLVCITKTQSGGLDIYVVGTDGNIWNTAYGAGGWAPWTNYLGNPSGSMLGGYALTCDFDNHTGAEEVYAVDTNGVNWERYWSGGVLSPWASNNPFL